jgi:hypothetical protein
MKNIAEMAGINKSNSLLYLILNDKSSIHIFGLRLYEPDNFGIQNISYKRIYSIASFIVTVFVSLKTWSKRMLYY